jgi:thiosulfate dehydrogenase [quinone] large subunit
MLQQRPNPRAEAKNMNNRTLAYALTRIAYGIIFLFYGIGKFRGGLSNFVGGMNQQFSGKLPAAMVMPFAYFIPFAETISGALIVLGLFTRAGLTLSGVLLIGLTFGVVILGQAPTVAHNLQYVLLNFVLLWVVDFNSISIDSLIGKRPAVGFTASA